MRWPGQPSGITARNKCPERILGGLLWQLERNRFQTWKNIGQWHTIVCLKMTKMRTGAGIVTVKSATVF